LENGSIDSPLMAGIIRKTPRFRSRLRTHGCVRHMPFTTLITDPAFQPDA
jgi:hypothetical protein